MNNEKYVYSDVSAQDDDDDMSRISVLTIQFCFIHACILVGLVKYIFSTIFLRGKVFHVYEVYVFYSNILPALLTISL